MSSQRRGVSNISYLAKNKNEKSEPDLRCFALNISHQGSLRDDGVGGSPVGTDLTLLLLFLANPFILSSIHLTLIFLAYLEKGRVGVECSFGGSSAAAALSDEALLWRVERTDAGR